MLTYHTPYHTTLGHLAIGTYKYNGRHSKCSSNTGRFFSRMGKENHYLKILFVGVDETEDKADRILREPERTHDQVILSVTEKGTSEWVSQELSSHEQLGDGHDYTPYQEWKLEEWKQVTVLDHDQRHQEGPRSEARWKAKVCRRLVGLVLLTTDPWSASPGCRL